VRGKGALRLLAAALEDRRDVGNISTLAGQATLPVFTSQICLKGAISRDQSGADRVRMVGMSTLSIAFITTAPAERSMRRINTAIALASIVIAGACGGSGGTRVAAPPVPFYSPTVGLRDVKMGSVGILGGSMDVVLNVYNPNDYSLVAPRVSYRVMVDQMTIGTGVFDSDITVSSMDSARVRVPVQFTYKGVSAAGRSAANTGTVNYRVLGHIVVGTPYGRLSAPYDRVGQYAAIALPWPR